MKKLIILLILFSPLFAKYEISLKLEKVIREPELKQEMKVEDGKTFDDEIMTIIWKPSPQGFYFELTNKTNSTITIIWDESSFINESGNVSKVVHGDVRLIEKDQPIVPTNIPLLAKKTDVFLPIDYVYFGTAKKYGWGSAVKKWRYIDIYDDMMKDKDYEKIKDKEITFRTVITINIGEQKFTYHFFFKSYGRILEN